MQYLNSISQLLITSDISKLSFLSKNLRDADQLNDFLNCLTSQAKKKSIQTQNKVFVLVLELTAAFDKYKIVH